jgi:hypothetical protein
MTYVDGNLDPGLGQAHKNVTGLNQLTWSQPYSFRAVPFKYTWEGGGTSPISDTPPTNRKKKSTHRHQNLIQ